GAVAGGVGRVVAAWDPAPPPAGELIVAADLGTADPAVGVVAAEGLTDERIAGEDAVIVPLSVRPQAAGVAANEATGPAEHPDRRRRLVGRRRPDRQVGRQRRLRHRPHAQRNEGYEGQSFHVIPSEPSRWREARRTDLSGTCPRHYG